MSLYSADLVNTLCECECADLESGLTDTLGEELHSIDVARKSACLDFSSGSVMQNKSLNAIDTALSFELNTRSSHRVADLLHTLTI